MSRHGGLLKVKIKEENQEWYINIFQISKVDENKSYRELRNLSRDTEVRTAAAS